VLVTRDGRTKRSGTGNRRLECRVWWEDAGGELLAL
jgi:hypothetical protein